MDWPDIPEKIRSIIIDQTFDMFELQHDRNINELNKLLAIYHATYNMDNTISFESEKHYHWFLLKWQ
jgi:hypothetical protein